MLLHVAVAVMLTTTVACSPPRRLPDVPPGEWSALLGDASRSAYADEVITGQPTEAWRQGVGRGTTSAVQVHGNALLVTTTSRTIVVLDARSGMQYWSRGFRSQIAGGVLKHGDRVFVGTGIRDRRLHAVEITRGRGIWSRDVGTVRVEPILHNGHVIAATDEGEVVALAESDGTIEWRVRLRAPPAVSPVVHEGHVVVATTRDTLYRIEANSGVIVARSALPGTASAPPLVHRNSVVLPLQDGNTIGVTLPALEIAWTASLDAPSLAAPVTAEDDIYVLTRNASVWRIRGGQAHRIAELGGAATGSLTATRNQLLVGRLDGSLFALDLDGRVVWRTDFEDSIVAPVAIDRGSVYVPLFRGDIVKLQ